MTFCVIELDIHFAFTAQNWRDISWGEEGITFWHYDLALLNGLLFFFYKVAVTFEVEKNGPWYEPARAKGRRCAHASVKNAAFI